jgi:hypothetical protein
MNTTNYVFSVTSKTCRNPRRGAYCGIPCHPTSRCSAVRYGLYKLYAISHRPYSSRARRIKDSLTAKATPRKDLELATRKELLEGFPAQNTSSAKSKDSSPAAPVTDLLAAPKNHGGKHVDHRSKASAVNLQGRTQRYGRDLYVCYEPRFTHNSTAYPERLLIWNAGVFKNAFIGITNIAPLVFMGWGLIYWAPSYIMSPDPDLASWYAIPGSCP